jgi:hypothetical protein
MKETIETNRDWRVFWKSVGERTGRDDLFRQVGRTVGGGCRCRRSRSNCLSGS